MRNPDRETTFRFRQFEVSNCRSAMKIGTDGVLLGAWMWGGHSVEGECPGRVLDVGSGTGVIALMAAQRWPGAEIVGVEIDPVAAEECGSNFAASPWGERLTVECCDFASFTTSGFDLIVSNPPFFTDGALAPDDARRTARHELSLTVGTLLRRSALLLNPGGRIALVTPADREKDVRFEATMARLSVARLTRVATVAGKLPKRLLWEFVSGGGVATVEDTLTLRRGDGSADPRYAALVGDFYTKNLV